MKKIFNKTLILFIALICLSVAAYGHSGRTDAKGGPRDNNNISGLGKYHYHCGGHPAHLHYNNLCPYDILTLIEKISLQGVN